MMRAAWNVTWDARKRWLNARRRAIITAALVLSAPAVMVAAEIPNFDGIWQIETPIAELKTSDGKAPPLKPEAEKIYEEHRQKFARGDLSFDPSHTSCKPPGEPRILYERFPLEIVQTRKQIFFTYKWNRLYRVVDIGEPQAVLTPTYFGTSSAKWRGDVLEVYATGFQSETFLDPAGMPHSDKLKLTEKFRLRDKGKKIEVSISIDDPQTFLHPWETKATLVKLPSDRLGEDVCETRVGLVKKEM